MSDTEHEVAANYRRWAASEAKGRSDLYERTAELIATDNDLLAFLADLPAPKRQPNLFLAAVQYLFGAPTSAGHFRVLVLEHREQVAAVISERATQTNLPARCATLLPALAEIDGPLALLEVGAPAGLCPIPDRYDYLFIDAPDTLARHRRGPTTLSRPGRGGPQAPEFRCAVNPETPRPTRHVDVVWRAGLDLNPLDTAHPDTRAWLDALVWPGEEHLRAGLHRALDVAAADPPSVERGDLVHDLLGLAARAPEDATLVVFHTAVLAYVAEAADRERFAAEVGRLRRERRTVWLANEAPARIPGLPAKVIEQHPPGKFLLCRDAVPIAHTDPHGAFITWLDTS